MFGQTVAVGKRSKWAWPGWRALFASIAVSAPAHWSHADRSGWPDGREIQLTHPSTRMDRSSGPEFAFAGYRAEALAKDRQASGAMMRRWTWLAAIAAVPVLACVGAAGWLYARSEAVLHHRYPVSRLADLRGSGDVSRGAHLAIIYGCTDCHGDDLRGRPFPHPAPFTAVTAANLTRKARRYSDADFVRVVREGVTPQGYSVEFMPSNAFVRMADDEAAAIIAYVRSVPTGGEDTVEWRPGLRGRLALARGDFPPGAAFMDDARRKPPRDLGSDTAVGRHLASVACAECHGSDLTGDKSGKPPDLSIAAAYDPADFHRLLKTGSAAGGRQVGMMSAVARKRFSHLTDDEIEAIRLYLVARASAPTT
jgi:mono/diheme cytochrome c family protein